MAPYLGFGTVDANVSSFFQLTANANGAGSALVSGNGTFDPPPPEGLTVTYVFTPRGTVPEPGTLALLGMGGLAGLGFARRRVKHDG
jgi:hypothetical protein